MRRKGMELLVQNRIMEENCRYPNVRGINLYNELIGNGIGLDQDGSAGF